MIPFSKYHGAGNDFIIIDNRNKIVSENHKELFKLLCNRHLGIGGDGLILLQSSKEHDFEMFYVNSDGKPSSMCGNGGRCIVAFAKKTGVVENEATFMAIDGFHTASISSTGEVKLKMGLHSSIKRDGLFYVLNTGSPHLVLPVKNIDFVKVKETGKQIRDSDPYAKEGININFMEIISSSEAYLRTYERGVEDETLSCGTGVTAASIVLSEIYGNIGSVEKIIHTRGGILKVSFERKEEGEISDLYLEGPTQLVYEGIWPLT